LTDTETAQEGPSPDISWSYATESGIRGPLSREDLLRHRDLGLVTPRPLVHSDQMEGWLPFETALAREAETEPAPGATVPSGRAVEVYPPQPPPAAASSDPAPSSPASGGWAEDLGCIAAVLMAMGGLFLVLLVTLAIIGGGNSRKTVPFPVSLTFCERVDPGLGPIHLGTAFPPGRVSLVVGNLPGGHPHLEVELSQVDETNSQEHFFRSLTLPIAQPAGTCTGELSLEVRGVYRVRVGLPGGTRLGEENLRIY